MDEIRKNDRYTVLTEGYSSEAFGVCRVKGRAVFLPGAIPGESWEIQILKVTNTAIYAKGLRLLSPASGRVNSDCPWYGKCGGCDTRHLSYEEELSFKLGRVNDALHHIGKQNLSASEILGSQATARYRNKAIFAVAERNGLPDFGFYRERSHELISVEDCLLQTELSCRSARAVVEFLQMNGLPAYDETTGRGTVRHIFCRQAYHGKDAVLCISTASGFGARTQELTELLRQRCPELSGIVLNVNKTRGNTVLAGEFYPLWGDPMLHDTLCGLSFSIAPQAFFQINPPQAERLYEKAAEYAQAGPEDLVFDLYCGAGTISLRLARDAGRVIGAEIVPEAVENAGENARQNGISNVEFLCADAGEAAKTLSKRGLRPAVVVVDPPRKGMSEDAVEALASMAPERVVYVSCNPATLARDILRFQSFGYLLRDVTAVDMFPRTCHVETVVLLTRNT